MKLLGLPVLLFLILSLSSALVLNFSSQFFLFSLFNTLVLSIIILGSNRPSSTDEIDGAWFYSHQDQNDDMFHYTNNIKDEYKNHGDDDSDDDDCRKENYFSDGYDEDDDDSSSDGEVGWDDDDEEEEEVIDENLQRRIEDFIAKVNKGWREEWLRENLDNQF
ncbi:secreted acidic protein 1A [Jatropha curcas]|uniref:secreted acidic protein 1A n=1 Tax=Jatropha curcas TaxID=180498 RepID=UPI0005FBBC22|nr:secreted acidic protein 1A [Jatropha curcas]